MITVTIILKGDVKVQDFDRIEAAVRKVADHLSKGFDAGEDDTYEWFLEGDA